MSYTERTDCRLCGGALEKVLDLGRTPLANALSNPSAQEHWMEGDSIAPCQTYPLYLSRCITCGHVQLPVVVDPKLLFPVDYPYASATGEAMRNHLDKMAEELSRDVPKDGLVAEFGSNDGYLLSAFRRATDGALRVIGIDPASALAAAATHSGKLTVPEFFDVPTAWAIRHACGRANLIVANNVFAHADDLHEIVEGVKVLLADDGRFVFEVGYLPYVLAKNNWPVVYHEHLSYHSVRPLVDFFGRHKLSLYRCEPIDTQGGSMRFFVAWSRMAETSIQERWSFEDSDTAGWQSRIERAANVLSMHLGALKHQGKTIAGYGCSAKSTTLLHVAGIGRETIDFICDSNPLKVGKFSPGKHIPIVHPDELEKRQPDYCVSLSGNFSEAFRARHPGYRGQWIEPRLSVDE